MTNWGVKHLVTHPSTITIGFSGAVGDVTGHALPTRPTLTFHGLAVTIPMIRTLNVCLRMSGTSWNFTVCSTPSDQWITKASYGSVAVADSIAGALNVTAQAVVTGAVTLTDLTCGVR